MKSCCGLGMEVKGIVGDHRNVVMDDECWIDIERHNEGVQGRERAHFPGQRMDGGGFRRMTSRMPD